MWEENMIREIEKAEINECASVIRDSFKTVALEFGINNGNCPGHTSFISTEKLQDQYTSNRLMFVYVEDSKIIGYCSLKPNKDGSYELDNLAILLEYRHKGFGKEMAKFAMYKVRELGRDKMTIGIMEENGKFKKWYSDLGFVHIGTKKFQQLPFTVGVMEINV